MSDISLGTLGFQADTGPLLSADAALAKLQKTAAATEAALLKMASSTKAALSGLSPSLMAAVTGQSPAAANAATTAEATSATAQKTLAAATGTATAAVAAQNTALTAGAHAHQSHGAAAYGNRLQMMELGHVGRALFDEMAAGGNIFRGLAMESGRLQVALTSGEGGLTGALGRIASSAAGLVNPIVLGAAALGGFSAAALYAANSYRTLQDLMDRSVMGVGHFSGLSGSSLGTLAEGLSSTGLGLSDRRSAVQTFASGGHLDAGNIEGATGLVRGYAGAFGTSFKEAGSKLNDIFADPVRGASALNERLGFLDDKTRSYIKTLRDQGDAQGAIRTLIEASSTSMNEQAEKLGVLGQLWKNVQDDAATFRDRLAKASSGPTDQERYNAASRNADRGLGEGIGTDTSNIAESSRFRSMLAGSSPMMRLSQQNEVQLNRESLGAGDIVRSLLPDLAARVRLTDQQSSLSKSLSNPDVVERLGPGAADAREALERLNTAMATFQTSAERIADASRSTVAVTLARTASERVAIEYERNYREALERTHSALEASVTAESKRNEAIAESTRTALDALRSTSDRASLVGLSPYDRIMRENDQRFRDLQVRAITVPTTAGSGVALPPSGTASGMATPGMIADASSRTSLPPALIAALGQVENGGRLTGGTDIRGADGRPASSAYGFGQITAGAEADVRKALPGFDRTKPDTAVLGAATYLKELVDRNHGDVRAALGAYAGPDPNHDGSGNSGYIDKVLRLSGGGIQIAPGTGASAVAPGTATLANRVNFAVGRQADVSDLLMRGPQQTSLAIESQAASFKTLQSVIGQGAGTVAAAVERQKELNAVREAGASKEKLFNDFGEAGLKMWDKLTAAINTNAEAAGRLAQAEDEQKKRTAGLDSVRGNFSSGLNTFVTDMEQGKGWKGSARDTLHGLGERLQTQGINSLTSSLFGENGSAGGGLFGDALGGLMGGSKVSSMSVSAGSVTVVGGIGNALGAGGGGSGGGLLGGLGSLFHIGGGSSDPFSILPKFAGGTDDAPGGLSLVGEKGPELVNLPRHAQVIPNGKGLGGGQAPGHTFQFGDVHIHPVGGAQFTPDQVQQIRGQVTAGQRETVDHITRNFHGISAGNQQYS